jgi:membrane-bound acyltransferase YfiQ involved in biofilm formation
MLSSFVRSTENGTFLWFSTPVVLTGFDYNFFCLEMLSFVTFRRWAPLLHRYFTEVDVAACQFLFFFIQDFLMASHQKYPKG